MPYDWKQLLDVLPKDDELAAAQANDTRNEGWNEASDALYSAFTRQPYAKMDRGPGEAEKLTKQRAAAAQQIDSATKLQDFGEAHDPNSPAAQTHRQLLATLTGQKPEAYAGMSVKQMNDLLPVQKEIIEAQKIKKTKEMGDAELTALKRNVGALYPGRDLEGLGADSLKLMLMQFDHAANRDAAGARATTTHEDSVAGRAAKAAHDAEMGKQKDAALDVRRGAQNFHQAQFNVNNWAPDSPDTPPLTMQQKNEASSQITAANVVRDHVKEAREIIERNHGSIFNQASNDYTRFVQLLEEMGPQITTAGGYGNYTQAHEKIVKNLVSHPNELLNWFNSGRLTTQLDGLETGVGKSLAQRQHDLGYHDKRAGESSGVTQYQTPMRSPEQQRASSGAPAPVQVRQKSTGKVVPMPADKAQRLLSAPGGDNYEVVK